MVRAAGQVTFTSSPPRIYPFAMPGGTVAISALRPSPAGGFRDDRNPPFAMFRRLDQCPLAETGRGDKARLPFLLAPFAVAICNGGSTSIPDVAANSNPLSAFRPETRSRLGLTRARLASGLRALKAPSATKDCRKSEITLSSMHDDLCISTLQTAIYRCRAPSIREEGAEKKFLRKIPRNPLISLDSDGENSRKSKLFQPR